MRQGIKEKDINDFVKYARKLNEVMERIRKYNPEACLYAEEEALILLNGSPHDEYGKSHTEREVEFVAICGMDSGAW